MENAREKKAKIVQGGTGIWLKPFRDIEERQSLVVHPHKSTVVMGSPEYCDFYRVDHNGLYCAKIRMSSGFIPMVNQKDGMVTAMESSFENDFFCGVCLKALFDYFFGKERA